MNRAVEKHVMANLSVGAMAPEIVMSVFYFPVERVSSEQHINQEEQKEVQQSGKPEEPEK